MTLLTEGGRASSRLSINIALLTEGCILTNRTL